jgi:hypothetical protein
MKRKRPEPLQSRSRLGTLLACALLLGACAPAERQPLSAEGKKLCLERVAQVEPGTPLDAKRTLYRACLKTIEAERAQGAAAGARDTLQAQQRQVAATRAEQAGWASDADRLVHCRLYQQPIIAAERERLRALAPVMAISRQYGVNSPQAQEANAAYQQRVAELERLIPPAMRQGRPLLPDAVQAFMRCDPADFPVN